MGVLLQGSTTTYTALDANPDDGFSFGGLAVGDYTLTFLGAGSGQYSGQFAVTTPDVTPVPEPSAGLLLLAGLGLLGWRFSPRRNGSRPGLSA